MLVAFFGIGPVLFADGATIEKLLTILLIHLLVVKKLRIACP
ncbi:DUF6954 family protein [Peribacillus deserti]